MEKLTRSFEIEVGEIRSEQRIVTATLSSTYPVRRHDGDEVLSHDPGAVDLSREPLPLLCSHNNRALPVGVVEGLRLDGGRLRGNLRFSQSQDDLWRDVQDGIVRNLSVGYVVKERKKQTGGYLVTKWLPYECSLVAAPADPTVGIGRDFNNYSYKEKSTKMDKNDLKKAKKEAVEELGELAKSGENAERMEELKGEIRALDGRLEAFEVVDSNKSAKDSKDFKPEITGTKDRSLIITGGPMVNPTYSRMFNGGQPIVVNDDEMRAFRDQMKEGLPSSGGFAVPEPLSAKWLDDAYGSAVVLPLVPNWPMTSASLKIPGWDCSDNSAGTFFGGFALEWLDEAGTGTKQVGKLRLITLAAKKAGIFVDASSEAVEDAPSLDSQIDLAMRKSLGLGIDYTLLNGTGGGQPLGMLNDPAYIEVAKESGQTADTIQTENITKLLARMYPAGRSRCVFIANDTCIPQLYTMSISVGTGGAPAFIFKEGVNGTYTLMGRPIYFTPNLPSLGNANDIICIDPSQYVVGIRRDMRLEKSTIPGWTQDLVSYRVLMRIDAQGTWNTYFTPRNGDSMSWVVGLAERA